MTTYGLRPAVPVRLKLEPAVLDPAPGHCRDCDRPLDEPDVVGRACPRCIARYARQALPADDCLGDALARGEAPWAAGELAEQPDCIELVHRDAAVVPPREPWMEVSSW